MCDDRSIALLVYSHLMEVSEEKQHGEKVINSLWDESKQYIFEWKTNRIAFIYFRNTKKLIYTNCDILVLYATDSRIKLFC
jgi:hypothetical protein